MIALESQLCKLPTYLQSTAGWQLASHSIHFYTNHLNSASAINTIHETGLEPGLEPLTKTPTNLLAITLLVVVGCSFLSRLKKMFLDRKHPKREGIKAFF